MSAKRYRDSGPDNPGIVVVPDIALATAAPQSNANAIRLAVAHKHLDKMFLDAAGEQIDGRAFYGRIILEIPFENGSAQDILASKMARDRCCGGRQN